MREKSVRAKAKSEAGKQRSIDSRYIVAQQRAEERAAAEQGTGGEPPTAEPATAERTPDDPTLPTGGASSQSATVPEALGPVV